MYIIFLWPKCS